MTVPASAMDLCFIRRSSAKKQKMDASIASTALCGRFHLSELLPADELCNGLSIDRKYKKREVVVLRGECDFSDAHGYRMQLRWIVWSQEICPGRTIYGSPEAHPTSPLAVGDEVPNRLTCRVVDKPDQPVWYFVSDGQWTRGVGFRGTVYRSTGTDFLRPYDPSQLHPVSVGVAEIAFTPKDYDFAFFVFTIDGKTITKFVRRQKL